MCCDGKSQGAQDGRVSGRLSAGTFQVAVPGVGTVTAVDRTGRAQKGGAVTVVRVGEAWRIV